MIVNILETLAEALAKLMYHYNSKIHSIILAPFQIQQLDSDQEEFSKLYYILN